MTPLLSRQCRTRRPPYASTRRGLAIVEQHPQAIGELAAPQDLADRGSLCGRRLCVGPNEIWLHVARNEDLAVLPRQLVADLPVLVAIERLDQQRHLGLCQPDRDMVGRHGRHPLESVAREQPVDLSTADGFGGRRRAWARLLPVAERELEPGLYEAILTGALEKRLATLVAAVVTPKL